MPQQQQVDIPVFLFTGFLEAGKTRFIKQVALTDPAFRSGERTLLMVCEEGEEEYDAEELKKQNVFVEIVEQEIDLSEKIMTYLLKKNTGIYIPAGFGFTGIRTGSSSCRTGKRSS